MSGFWVKLAKTPKLSRTYNVTKQPLMDVLIPVKGFTKTLVFLHGAANSTEMYHSLFMSEWSPVSDDTRVILPSAPIRKLSISKNNLLMPSWYDIFTMSRDARSVEEIYDLAQLRESVSRVHDILTAEAATLNSSKDLFLGGISQGCALALHAGLTFQQPLGGIIALSGYHINTCKAHKTNVEVPIFLSHGTADTIVSTKYMYSTIKYLQYANPNLEISEEEELGHTINEEQMGKIKRWYNQRTTQPGPES